jgi:hypothetical protein
VNPLTEKSANVLVRRVYLADHKGLYQNCNADVGG